MDVFVELKAIISEFQAKMVEARGEMEETSKKGGSSFSGLQKVGSMALLGVGVAAAGVGLASIKMANDFEDSHAKLVTAIKDTGGNMDALSPKINAADKSMEKFGFTNAQTQEALAVGTTALGSSSKALDILGTAANLAAYKHVDLSTAMVAVAKGVEGNLRPLKQLGIDLPVVASSAEKVKVAQENLAKAQANVTAILKQFPNAASAASKEHGKYETAINKVSAAQQKLSDLQKTGGTVLDQLNKRMGGQAAAAADTFSGRMNVAKARVEDMGAKIGSVLIPAIEHLISWLFSAGEWLGKHKIVLEVLGATLTVVAAAMVVAWVSVAAAATSAFIAENAATLGIVAGIELLVIGIVYLSTHWKQVWGDITSFTKRNSLAIAGALVFLLGPFGVLLGGALLLALHWKQIWHDIRQWTLDGVNAVVGFFLRMGHDIKQWTLDATNAVTGFFIRMWRDVTGWTSRIWHDVAGFFSNMWRDTTSYASRIKTDVSNWFGLMKDAIFRTATTIWQNVTGFFAAIWRDVVGGAGWVVRLAHDVGQWFTGIVFGILTIMGKLPGDLLQVGKDIIMGLVHGIMSVVNLGAMIGDWLHKEINKALSFLGIHLSQVSDSSTMFQVGKKMMLSWVAGIRDHVSHLTNAVGVASGAAAAAATGGAAALSAGAAAGGGPAANQALGQQMAAAMGWTGAEWVALNNVAMRESGWSSTAQNPTSSAYGIAQNIGGLAGYGPNGNDPAVQIAWMLNYIKGRYGDPIGAWNHEISAGWYDKGGLLPPGLSLALNTTGRAEVVRPGPAQDAAPTTIILQVDGKTLGNVVLTQLLREQQRRPLGIKTS